MRPEILERLNKSTNQVNLMNLQITDDELVEITNFIMNNKKNLCEFFLDNNKISDVGAAILADTLSKLNMVNILSIQFNDIGKEGAIKLFSIKNNFPAINIAFHGNKIINVSEMEQIVNIATGKESKNLFPFF